MFRKKFVKKEYDKNLFKPVLHCSICTGEQVAGFKNLETGKFNDVMLIKSDKDLKSFMEMYGVTELEKDY
jgi:hypothetical protein